MRKRYAVCLAAGLLLASFVFNGAVAGQEGWKNDPYTARGDGAVESSDLGSKFRGELAQLYDLAPNDTYVTYVRFSDRPPTSADHDPLDLPPVRTEYIDQTRSSQGISFRAVDELQNAVSVRATGKVLAQIAKLPFVRDIYLVPTATAEGPCPFSGGVGLSHSCVPPPPPPPPPPPHSASDHGPLETVMTTIDVEALHAAGYTGSNMRIAILDSGIDISHEVYQSKASTLIWKDFFADDPEPFDDGGHGTAISGVAIGNFAGSAQNPPYRGVAYDAILMAGKVSEFTLTTLDKHSEGIKWAVANNAHVISLSYGFGCNPLNQLEKDGRSVWDQWVAYAVIRGVPVVTGAGNGGTTVCGGSAINGVGDAFSVITVGATSADGSTIWPDSARGPTKYGRVKPDLAAPGWNLVLPRWLIDDDYIIDSGTSVATPVVAGAVALLRQKHPEWNPAQIKAALRGGAADRGVSGPDNTFGHGLLQVETSADSPIDMDLAWDTVSTRSQDNFYTINFGFVTYIFRFNVRYTLDSLTTSEGAGPAISDHYVFEYFQTCAWGSCSTTVNQDMQVHSLGSARYVWIDNIRYELVNARLFAPPAMMQSDGTNDVLRTIFVVNGHKFFMDYYLYTDRTSLWVHILTDGTYHSYKLLTYHDVDLLGASYDYAESTTGSTYFTETKIDFTQFYVKDTQNDLMYLKMFPIGSASTTPEWLLRYPCTTTNPDVCLNGQSIYSTNGVYYYQGYYGSVTSGLLGSTLYHYFKWS